MFVETVVRRAIGGSFRRRSLPIGRSSGFLTRLGQPRRLSGIGTLLLSCKVIGRPYARYARQVSHFFSEQTLTGKRQTVKPSSASQTSSHRRSLQKTLGSPFSRTQKSINRISAGHLSKLLRPSAVPSLIFENLPAETWPVKPRSEGSNCGMSGYRR